MTTVPGDYVLGPDDLPMPLLWVTDIPGAHPLPDYTDTALEPLDLPAGRGRLVRSWGHTDTGAHWLLTRGGTPVHTDKAYLRYTHQIVLRNDGTRIRGLPSHDPTDPFRWPPPLTPGVFYCLDTHSPHQGTTDPRLPQHPSRIKLVAAVDRDEPLTMGEAFRLLAPFLHRHPTDDAMTTRPPRWKPRPGP